MDPAVGQWVICLVVAWLLLAIYSKPVRKAVGGWVSRDRKGRLVVALTPLPRKRRRRR